MEIRGGRVPFRLPSASVKSEKREEGDHLVGDNLLAFSINWWSYRFSSLFPVRQHKEMEEALAVQFIRSNSAVIQRHILLLHWTSTFWWNSPRLVDSFWWNACPLEHRSTFLCQQSLVGCRKVVGSWFIRKYFDYFQNKSFNATLVDVWHSGQFVVADMLDVVVVLDVGVAVRTTVTRGEVVRTEWHGGETQGSTLLFQMYLNGFSR